MRIWYFLTFVILIHSAVAQEVNITLNCDKPVNEISPLLYGLFYEDINFSGDGGLFAELVQNRSFEYHPIETEWEPKSMEYHPLTAWEPVEKNGGSCSLSVERAIPLNRNNLHYLVIRIKKPGEGVGVRNLGYDGIRIDKNELYNISFYARRTGKSAAPLQFTIEDPSGNDCGSFSVESPGIDWKKYEGVIRCERTEDNASLVLTTRGDGEVFLDMVSLMPQKTYKNRKNGLRPDLVEALAGLNPKFLRFPGGCIVHGHSLQNAYRWKDSVGDPEKRRANWSRWGYHQTYGIGFFEYFQLCEDLGVEPLPVLPVAVSCGGIRNRPYQAVPMHELQEWIDDVLDLIEFANGPADSEWGKVRAEMGHAAPFNMKYICLGNEEHDTPECRERFPGFVEAIKEKYPEIRIIGTSGQGAGAPLASFMKELEVDITDEHYYQPPEWLIANQNRFDKLDRDNMKIFVGEYASRGNTLFNAVAEAAYLTGIERNSDLVLMACYAPLLAHVHHTQWKEANLIYFDKRNVILTPNYHVQKMFSQNTGDTYLQSNISYPEILPYGISISSTKETKTGDVILKIVNPNEKEITASVKLEGVSHIRPEAQVEIIAGGKNDKNSLEEPAKIVPVRKSIPVKKQFRMKLPAVSVQVVRIKTT